MTELMVAALVVAIGIPAAAALAAYFKVRSGQRAVKKDQRAD